MLKTPEMVLLFRRWLIFFSLGEAGSSEMAESILDRGSKEGAVETSADMVGCEYGGCSSDELKGF